MAAAILPGRCDASPRLMSAEVDFFQLFDFVLWDNADIDVSGEANGKGSGSKSSSGSSQADGRAFPEDGANHSLAPQAVQASHKQGRQETQLVDLTASLDFSDTASQALQDFEDYCSDAQTLGLTGKYARHVERSFRDEKNCRVDRRSHY